LNAGNTPAFLIYIDQGEELYVRADEKGRRRFSEVISEGILDSRLRVFMSMRSDFFGELQKDETLYEVRRPISVPPLREIELRNVVSRPAELLSARFETPSLIDVIARRSADDSAKDVGALPLLSYTLDDMWSQMVITGDGVLAFPRNRLSWAAFWSIVRINFSRPTPTPKKDLRRLFTLRLATVREDGEPTRRRAPRSEFSEQEWRLVSELALATRIDCLQLSHLRTVKPSPKSRMKLFLGDERCYGTGSRRKENSWPGEPTSRYRDAFGIPHLSPLRPMLF
jgi:hypothetical protein